MVNRIEISTKTAGEWLAEAAKAAQANFKKYTPTNRPKMCGSKWFNRGFELGVAAGIAEAQKKFRVGDPEITDLDGDTITVQLTDSMESVDIDEADQPRLREQFAEKVAEITATESIDKFVDEKVEVVGFDDNEAFANQLKALLAKAEQ